MRKEEMLIVRDSENNGTIVCVVRMNCNISKEMYPSGMCDEDGYTLQGLTRLEDGRYVELIYSGYEAEVYAQTVRDEKAYLHILQYEREELLEEPMFHDLKVEFEYLIREWTK